MTLKLHQGDDVSNGMQDERARGQPRGLPDRADVQWNGPSPLYLGILRRAQL